MSVKNYNSPSLPSFSTSLLFLGTMLFTSILIAGFTLRLLAVQDALWQDAITESNARALELLGNEAEHALMNAVRTPFHALKNADRMKVVASGTSAIRHIVLLDSHLHQIASWPHTEDSDKQLDIWVSRHFASEINGNFVSPRLVVEELGKKPVLLALQAPDPLDRTQGWILISFDLGTLIKENVEPLLQTFTASHGGAVKLEDPTAPWRDSVMHQPMTNVLSGWMLSYEPDLHQEKHIQQRNRYLLIGVSSCVVLALLLATYAVWRELRHEREMSALRNRFVANVSHELKTPLALIRLYVETLRLGRIKNLARRESYFDTIIGETERLTDMIDTVLHLDRLKQNKIYCDLRETDLLATVNGTLQRYRDMLIQRGARVHAQLAETVPAVAHDPRAITQVLLNLLNNAAEHAGAKEIEVKLDVSGPRVSLAVVDRGPGLSSVEIKTLLRALRRGEAAPSRRGSGLGLALVQQIADAHKAILDIAGNTDGEGLRVTLTFSGDNKHK